MSQSELSSLIWSVADLLRGDYRQSEYGRVILPFTVLRRLDCVLEPTKEAVLREKEEKAKEGINPDPFMRRVSGAAFYNASSLDMRRLVGDQDNIGPNLLSYVESFSPEVKDIFDRFAFAEQIDRLTKNKLLYLVTEKFAGLDLHPGRVSNMQMGLIFEELIRKFAEASNDTAGEHFTPREVIRLMVNLLFVEDDDVLSNPGVVRTIYDPTAGTGGMLSVADEYLSEHNPDARLTMYGQELNDLSYAICKADMLIKGQDVRNIVAGNTLSDDGHPDTKFDYMLSNPPFGVEWKKVQKEVKREHEIEGFNGRFGPGLPRVSDGSLLFLMHLLSKMRATKDGGSRFAIVLNGSPLFTGGAGSGESEIRRYVLENDLVEAIIGLPTDLFYNTGIATYVWVLSNRKPEHRKGLVQLIDASSLWQKMRKSLGSKRREISDEGISIVTRLFGDCAEARHATVLDSNGDVQASEILTGDEPAPDCPDGGKVRVMPLSLLLPNNAFGYRQITVERPLRVAYEWNDSSFPRLQALRQFEELDYAEQDMLAQLLSDRMYGARYLDKRSFLKDLSSGSVMQGPLLSQSLKRTILRLSEVPDDEGEVARDTRGQPKPNPKLRDTEIVPLAEEVEAYFKREVVPHVPDAWVDNDKTKIGYEIPFNRHFYVFQRPRDLEEIDAELEQVTRNIQRMLAELAA
ncbi:Type I restriction-modification system, DNA-methyltransferase subunit M [Roseibacterium elongatum DSM 19469]|uniref:site-specific DNA-methyltransferase (adenine-specific) n=1 Tax=Roseicyclus elongatus DSM 19469 TaxID=1294273 RepID=W8RYP9_9RHOB|nr:class I SAM-dependent DNA methyltransferase [Roseibacterium elongatum]AHM02972.1 Type I restriction-modification system, DNA-methyltransferase subunit M [Roseibacterium elongatum DSM 19469]